MVQLHAKSAQNVRALDIPAEANHYQRQQSMHYSIDQHIKCSKARNSNTSHSAPTHITELVAMVAKVVRMMIFSLFKQFNLNNFGLAIDFNSTVGTEYLYVNNTAESYQFEPQ